ncbi:MAG: CpsD/CapB family tyrosine-protein kinase [Candidatus Rokuibacteriota bacterium]|nr:MAG: CpsD/CapB family tyrosine-protein kinase [Candidatus Rokubacteria bacterium]
MRLLSRLKLPETAAPPEWERLDEHLVSLVAVGSFEAEQYRVLRHIVEQFYKDADLRVLGLTSATVGDGKTTTALNLAGALAQASDARVLLIDGDIRRGLVRERLGLRDTSAGLAEAILDANIPLASVARHCSPFNLWVLPTRPGAPAPYELLKSPRFGELIQEARQQYDYVVVDAPPLIPVPDFRVIAKHVDGFLMIVGAHKTPRRLVEEALDILDPAKVLGLVFNGDSRPLAGYYSYSAYRPYIAEPSVNGHSWSWRGRRGRDGARASSDGR